jgi:hypothetical protein
MSVLTKSFKQTNGYFVPLASALGKVMTYTAGTGAGGSYLPGSFTVATWASTGTTANVSSLLGAAPGNGTLLKDMGKTVVSANRTFRKVQLVVPGLGSVSTAGVSSEASNASVYYTGYIELAGPNAFSSGVATALPVAYLPGLL